jgi:hypothetical protein
MTYENPFNAQDFPDAIGEVADGEAWHDQPKNADVTDILPTEYSDLVTSSAITTPREPLTPEAIASSLTGGAEFIGPEADTVPDLERSYFAYIAEIRNTPLANVSEVTPRDIETDKIARAGLMHLGSLIGIDIQDQVGAIRSFDTQKNYEQAFADLGIEHDGSKGTYGLGSGILWTRTDDSITEMSGRIHERVHAASKHFIEIKVTDRTATENHITPTVYNGLWRPGVVPDHESKGLVESVTNMAMTRIMRENRQMWSVSHAPATIITDAVIKEVARKQGESEQGVEFALFRSLFGTDLSSIEMIHDALGPERALGYVSIKDPTLEEIPQLAYRLNLPEAATTYQRLRDDGHFDLFEWQTPWHLRPMPRILT